MIPSARDLSTEGRLTGSWLAAHASGHALSPGLVPTRAEVPCPLCGYEFSKGELGHINPVRGSRTFNDAYSMRHTSDRDPVCSACLAMVSGNKFLQALSKAMATLDGLWPLAANADRAWWILDPPEPPFVMVVGTATQQHLYWRTPIAYSRDVFPIRVGSTVGYIRRPLLQRAVELIPTFLAAIDADRQQQPAYQKAKKSKNPSQKFASKSSHPFVRLDRELKDGRHGQLKSTAVNVLASPDSPPEFACIAELNCVECWALAAIANNTKPLVSRPRPIALPA